VDTTLVAVIRDGHVHTPRMDLPLEAHDELLLVAAPEREAALETLLSPHHRP
jgi:Trk K+ transport system NAD-binding subunit